MRTPILILALAACIGLHTASAQCPPITLSPATVPATATLGADYPTQVFSAAGGTAPYTYTLFGELPAGLTFVDGVLSGLTSSAGTFSFLVNVIDANGCGIWQPYSIQVDSAFVASSNITVKSGNGLIEPNECNTIQIRLLNRGRDPLTQVTATLTSDTPGVSLINDSSAYPDIPGLGSATNLRPFVVATDATVPCFSQIVLRLHLSATGQAPAVLPFVLTVGQAGDNYVIVGNGTGTIPPGTLLPVSQADDQLIPVPLPFGLSVYGNYYPAGTFILISTNGNLQFDGQGSRAFVNESLPSVGLYFSRPERFPAVQPTICPFWDDLLLTTPDGGVFTSVTGSAPNRVFTIEWRGTLFNDRTAQVDFAVQFTEGSAAFDFIYRNEGVNVSSATIGLQATSNGPLFTQFTPTRTTRLFSGARLTVARPLGSCTVGDGVCTAPPIITSPLPPSVAQLRVPYSHTFTATGSPAPTFQVTSGILPPGLTLSAGGVLSGTPTAATPARPITVTASNGEAPSDAQTFNLQVLLR